MNGDRPHAWARWVFTVTALTILLLVGVHTAAADPLPGPTAIKVTAEMTSASEVTVSGLLTDRDGRAVPNATVQAKLSGVAVGGTVTDAGGAYRFSFTLPEGTRGGEQQLVAFFSGSGDLDASQSTTTVQTGEAPPRSDPPESPAPQPSPPPPVDLPDVRLTVTLAPELVPLGGLVMVGGTLTDEDGNGIPNAKIVLLLDGKESADSLVLTGPEGEFNTFAEVPSNQPEGTAELVVSFAGNASYDPHSETFTITVEEIDTATTPAESTTAANPSDEPAATAAATSESTGTTVVESATPAEDRDPLSWFYVALIAVGGLTLLVAGGLVFRAMYAQRDMREPEEDSLDLLLHGDEDADETGLLSEAFTDETLSEADGLDAGDRRDEPTDTPPPRRSAD